MLLRIVMCWCNISLSLQVSEAGVHRPHVGGIHGRSNDGSYSLVLAGGFEDEVVGYLYFFYYMFVNLCYKESMLF